MQSRPYQYALVAVLIGLAASLMGCRQAADAEVDKVKPTPQTITVSAAVAHVQALQREAEMQGALFARENAIVSSEVEGAIAEIDADFGDTVKAGQVMLRINPREYQLRVGTAQAALNQARARLANSSGRYRRAQELKNEGTISLEQFDQLAAALGVDQADVEAAEKALELARKKLSDTEIRAPFSGSVQQRMVSLGEYVAPGKQLYQLIATDPIKLRAPLPERLVPLARVGMPMRLTIDAQPGAHYTGAITRIAPALDESTRTMLVEAEVANPEHELKPGFFAHVTMNLGRDTALFVPSSAVLRYAGVARVFVIDHGVAHTREVTTGTIAGGQIEIIRGLKEGEEVATSEVDRLADGTPVDSRKQS